MSFRFWFGKLMNSSRWVSINLRYIYLWICTRVTSFSFLNSGLSLAFNRTCLFLRLIIFVGFPLLVWLTISSFSENKNEDKRWDFNFIYYLIRFGFKIQLICAGNLMGERIVRLLKEQLFSLWIICLRITKYNRWKHENKITKSKETQANAPIHLTPLSLISFFPSSTSMSPLKNLPLLQFVKPHCCHWRSQ